MAISGLSEANSPLSLSPPLAPAPCGYEETKAFSRILAPTSISTDTLH